MNDLEVEDIELDLLLDAAYRRYGYDFRSYARSSVGRRTRQFLSDIGESTISDIIPRIMRDSELFSRFTSYFSISVTELFRDPAVYLAIRQRVIPMLKTWPHIKIWHAGCATGEEVYSLAILLKEEGLYDRSTIYATDFNDDSLQRARDGVYGVDKIQEATKRYQESGGRQSLAEYYHAKYDVATFNSSLRDRITFANHNLAVDKSFGEMHLILCRNVMIYFNRDLQDRALEIFTDSLVHGGFLCIGTKEDLRFSGCFGNYDIIDENARIYHKRILS